MALFGNAKKGFSFSPFHFFTFSLFWHDLCIIKSMHVTMKIKVTPKNGLKKINIFAIEE
jgi:hypothetical protein